MLVIGSSFEEIFVPFSCSICIYKLFFIYLFIYIATFFLKTHIFLTCKKDVHSFMYLEGVFVFKCTANGLFIYLAIYDCSMFCRDVYIFFYRYMSLSSFEVYQKSMEKIYN